MVPGEQTLGTAVAGWGAAVQRHRSTEDHGFHGETVVAKAKWINVL